MAKGIHHGLSREELRRYSRHLMLPEVGLSGQVRLKNSSVLIVGTGGLGSAAATYLAAAGVGKIGLVDYDAVDPSNLQRQILHNTNSIGFAKVASARRQLLDLNPEIQIDTYQTSFSVENAEQIAAGYEILVDGTDNLYTRYLMNDLAVKTKKAYVYGSIHRFEGQVSVFFTGKGPCYRCVFQNPPQPETGAVYYEGGVLGILPGTIGTIQATEVIKLILGIGEPLIGKLLIYDAQEMSFLTIQLDRNLQCSVCGQGVESVVLTDYEQRHPRLDSPGDKYGLPAEKRIKPAELANLLKDGSGFYLVDVREAVELEISQIPGAVHVPIHRIEKWAARKGKDANIILICRNGEKSARAVLIFNRMGFERVRYLEGGVNAWAAEIDSSIPEY